MKGLLGNYKLFITLASLSLFVFALDILNIWQLPKSLVRQLTTPIQYGLYMSSVFVNKQLDFIPASRRSAQENKALKQQVAQLVGEKADLQKKLREAQAMINQQNGLSPQTFEMVPSRPIGSGRYLTIDKGTLDGIALGQVVVYRDNYIGQVKLIGPKTAQVMLSQDPDSKIAVFSQDNAGKARGILLGQFGSELLMDKILHQEPIAKDNLVYSEGTEGKLPRGLIMGKVEEVDERSNEVFKQAKIIPIYAIGDLDVVYVITGT